MFCRNCRNTLSDTEVICARCGCAKGTGSTYCPHCGQLMTANSTVCPDCGYTEVVQTAAAGKSKIAAGIIALCLGSLGIHNFYLGYTGKGVAQLLITLISMGTLSGISAIWAIVEGIMIFCGSIKTDAQGNPLV